MSIPARVDQLPLIGVFDAPDDGHDDESAVFGRMRVRGSVPGSGIGKGGSPSGRKLREVQMRSAARKL